MVVIQSRPIRVILGLHFTLGNKVAGARTATIVLDQCRKFELEPAMTVRPLDPRFDPSPSLAPRIASAGVPADERCIGVEVGVVQAWHVETIDGECRQARQ
jgi:hypothetical protein